MLWSLVCALALIERLLIKVKQRTAKPITVGCPYLVPGCFGHLSDRLLDIVDNDHTWERHNHRPRRQRARGA